MFTCLFSFVELNVTNQPNGTGIATEDADSKKVSGDLVEDGDNGTVAAVVIGIVTIVVLLVALVSGMICLLKALKSILFV